MESAWISGKTRVRRSRAVPPVRFVHPTPGGDAALVFTSALGGGLLEGDDHRYDVECREGSRLMLAPQANTRVFPCPNGRVSRQAVRGTVYADGLAVFGGDPVVPYAESRYEQEQRWVLHPGARLVVVDWMVAGRLGRGESFAFTSYESVMRVEDPAGRPLLVDTLRLAGPGVRDDMGGFGSLLTVYALGPGTEGLHAALDARLRETGEAGKPRWMEDGCLSGLGIREGRGFTLRTLGRERASLEPLMGLLFRELAAPEWLGFDFWARKY